RNTGVELALDADLVRGDNFQWNASFNISKNNNTIEKLAEGKAYLQGGLWWLEEGGKIGDFYGFEAINVFAYDESNAFTDDWDQLTPVFENGTFAHRYLLNGQEYSGNVNQKKLPNGQPFRGGDMNWEESAEHRDGVID